MRMHQTLDDSPGTRVFVVAVLDLVAPQSLGSQWVYLPRVQVLLGQFQRESINFFFFFNEKIFKRKYYNQILHSLPGLLNKAVVSEYGRLRLFCIMGYFMGSLRWHALRSLNILSK